MELAVPLPEEPKLYRSRRPERAPFYAVLKLKVRYLAKGVVPDHGEEMASSGYRDYDYLDWIARRREAFIVIPPGDDPPSPPQSVSVWLAARRNSWARLIRRVYEVDPLLCRCGERMRVVGFITQAPVIRKILDHVGRRCDPLKLPGRSPPLLEDFCHDPFPDYGPR